MHIFPMLLTFILWFILQSEPSVLVETHGCGATFKPSSCKQSFITFKWPGNAALADLKPGINTNTETFFFNTNYLDIVSLRGKTNSPNFPTLILIYVKCCVVELRERDEPSDWLYQVSGRSPTLGNLI